jgi:hypothetical protein
MSGEEMVEGIDYYMENGFMVLTAVYLRRRGHCCQSGCRHCPYGFKDSGGKANPAPVDAES